MYFDNGRNSVCASLSCARTQREGRIAITTVLITSVGIPANTNYLTKNNCTSHKVKMYFRVDRS